MDVHVETQADINAQSTSASPPDAFQSRPATIPMNRASTLGSDHTYFIKVDDNSSWVTRAELVDQNEKLVAERDKLKGNIKKLKAHNNMLQTTVEALRRKLRRRTA